MGYRPDASILLDLWPILNSTFECSLRKEVYLPKIVPDVENWHDEEENGEEPVKQIEEQQLVKEEHEQRLCHF